MEDLPNDQESGSIVFLTAPAGLSASSLTVTDTAIVDYSLSQITESGGQENLLLSYDVNYAAWETAPETTSVGETGSGATYSYSANSNLYRVIDYVNVLTELRNAAVLVGSNEYENVDAFVFPLLALDSVDDVVEVYQHMSSGDLLRLSESSLQSSYRFSDSLLSCPEQNDEGRMMFQNEGTCAWFSIGGHTRNADAAYTSIDYDENAWGISGGAQVEVADGWFLGGAVSYEDVSYSTSISNGDGARYQLGAVVKREVGNQKFALSVSGGRGDYNLTRNPLDTYGIATGKEDIKVNWASVQGRFTQHFDLGQGAYLEPYLGLGVTWVQQDGVELNGSFPFHLDAGSVNTTKFVVNPGVEIGQKLATSNGPLDMRFGIGFLGLFGDDFVNEVSAVNHAATAGTFKTTADIDDRFVELKARVSGKIGARTSIRLSAGALFGEHEQTFGGDLRLSYQF